ncbi:MAG: ATP-dependent DNA ligase [Candidatus Geothermarchaeales archaeon]
MPPRTATSFREFVTLCKELEDTASTNKKKRLIASFLTGLNEGEVGPGVLLMSSRLIPEKEQVSLGVGYEALRRAVEPSPFQYLVSFPRGVTILEVTNTLHRIAATRGRGSVLRKRSLLKGLYNRMTQEERQYLSRTLMGELRMGAVEGIVLGAIASASGATLESVRRAYMISGGLDEIAEIAMQGGEEVLQSMTITVFNPTRPMLASPSDSVAEALQETGVPAGVETKYDGARVQVHKEGPSVRIFSRRLSDVTASLRDVAQAVSSEIDSHRVLFEGEVVAVDVEGRPLPFQDLMRRFGRIRDIGKAVSRIPVVLRLFDVLLLDDEILIDRPYEDRYSILRDAVPENLLAERIVTSSQEEAQAFYEKALRAGHEGIVVKNLESPYSLGRRGKHWMKVKKADALDLVILGSDWGHGKRTGWLSDYYLAAYDPDGEGFQIVGKTFRGLTDAEIRQMTGELLGLKTRSDRYTVWVEPRIVVEVAFDEIQKSLKYPSGYALRLARIKRIRRDKAPREADDIREVARRYEGKFKVKGRLDI